MMLRRRDFAARVGQRPLAIPTDASIALFTRGRPSRGTEVYRCTAPNCRFWWGPARGEYHDLPQGTRLERYFFGGWYGAPSRFVGSDGVAWLFMTHVIDRGGLEFGWVRERDVERVANVAPTSPVRAPVPRTVPTGPDRMGQGFEGSITAEITFDSHEAIEVWLAERYQQIFIDCENAKAGALRQNRSDNGDCFMLIEPSLITACLLSSGARWRQREQEIDMQCDALREEAARYAAYAHARLDERLRADAIRAAAEQRVRERTSRLGRAPAVTTVAERIFSRTRSPLGRPSTTLVRGDA